MTPEEIADDAIACAGAGAAIVHIHVRDENGASVHRRDLYERAIGPIRDKLPDLVVCATTSSRVDPAMSARMTVLELDPAVRPDMASLTLGSFNFPKVASVNPPDAIEALLRRMEEQGVRPELEAFEAGMCTYANALMERGLLKAPLYCNILLGSLGSAPAFVDELSRLIQRLPPRTTWAAAGIGVFQRPMVMVAAAMGGNVRTGLEDNPRAFDGKPATNVGAVEFARAAAELAGRRLATPAEVRRRLGLPLRSKA